MRACVISLHIPIYLHLDTILFIPADFPILLDCPRLSNPIIDEDIFKFECYINYSLPVSNEARFLVQFLHDGVPNDQYSVVLSPPDTSVTLHEYFLRGHMGKYVSCFLFS